jgi:hypothetical protein
MTFLIADTFTDSRLTGDEQKAARTTAFDLQVDRLWVSGVKPVSEFLDDLADSR